MRAPPITLLLCALSCLAGCAAPYTVRTIGRGKTALHGSVGGPFFGNLGAPAPVPAVVVGARHGVTDDWDVHGSFHLLPALYGSAGIDLGVTRRLLQQRGAAPELTATLRLPMLTDFHSFRVFPELEAFASYLLRRRVLLYLGLTTLFDFFWERDAHVRVLWGPVVGGEVRFRRRYALGLAVRWISPQERTDLQVVDYVTPLGMIFLQLGLQVNLGGWP